QQFESRRHTVKLQAVILPDAQNSSFASVILPDARFGIVDPCKNRIFRFDDAHEAILVFGDAVVAPLRLLVLIEGHYPRAETQANQLMSTADSEHGYSRRVNEI